MQRPHKRHDHPQDQHNNLIEKIRCTFYNDLAEYTINEPDLTLDNIDEKINEQIQKTIINILDLSKQYEQGICLPDGTKINERNCPTKYLPFLKSLLNLKNGYQKLPREEVKFFNIIHSNLGENIKALAAKINSMDAFKETITNVKQFILEAKGLANSTTPQRELDTTGITPKLIRETFYNEMVTQTLKAIDEKLLSVDDLESREAHVYLALQALTLIESIMQSREYPGIRLLEDKLLTTENCPRIENFHLLFDPIFAIKENMQAISDNELQVLKRRCMCDDNELPDELMQYLTQNVKQCSIVINRIASEISQRKVFKEMIDSVIEFCLPSPLAEPEEGRRLGL